MHVERDEQRAHSNAAPSGWVIRRQKPGNLSEHGQGKGQEQERGAEGRGKSKEAYGTDDAVDAGKTQMTMVLGM